MVRKRKNIKDPTVKAIYYLREVLNIHENHLYPDDEKVFMTAISRLLIMEKQGFK